MQYVFRNRRNNEDSAHIYDSDDFIFLRGYAIGYFNAQGATIVGYHLTEVYNAPLHAEFFVVFPDKSHAVYTITEEG